MDVDIYRDLLRQARALSRSPEEAEDLVHETLLAGLEAQRGDPGWLSGVLRKRALMLARSSARRRRREAALTEIKRCPVSDAGDSNALLACLPPAARQVARLALHGLSAAEIRWILQLAPTAFRQRLTSIRKTIGVLPPNLQAEALALAYVRDPARSDDLQFGLVRRALHAAIPRRPGLGTHDHDGHVLIIHPHVSAPGGNG